MSCMKSWPTPTRPRDKRTSGTKTNFVEKMIKSSLRFGDVYTKAHLLQKCFSGFPADPCGVVRLKLSSAPKISYEKLLCHSGILQTMRSSKPPASTLTTARSSRISTPKNDNNGPLHFSREHVFIGRHGGGGYFPGGKAGRVSSHSHPSSGATVD